METDDEQVEKLKRWWEENGRSVIAGHHYWSRWFIRLPLLDRSTRNHRRSSICPFCANDGGAQIQR